MSTLATVPMITKSIVSLMGLGCERVRYLYYRKFGSLEWFVYPHIFAIVFSHLFNPADEGQRSNVLAYRLKALGLIVLCAGLGAVTFLSGTFDMDGFMKAANASISASDVEVSKDGKLKLFDATSK